MCHHVRRCQSAPQRNNLSVPPVKCRYIPFQYLPHDTKSQGGRSIRLGKAHSNTRTHPFIPTESISVSYMILIPGPLYFFTFTAQIIPTPIPIINGMNKNTDRTSVQRRRLVTFLHFSPSYFPIPPRFVSSVISS
ncbi:hypothetical protein LCGC14_2646320 [marine sediment metagenome]|uniref:Uncharacterized protein n=1 Tax=marine sediment metagenome TaxID=412755 RepID=A0A0F8ZW67_9ZZZZ